MILTIHVRGRMATEVCPGRTRVEDAMYDFRESLGIVRTPIFVIVDTGERQFAYRLEGSELRLLDTIDVW